MVHWLTVARCCMHLDERSASTLRLVQRATDRSEPNDSDLLNVDSRSWHRARPPCVSVMQSKSQACTREDCGRECDEHTRGISFDKYLERERVRERDRVYLPSTITKILHISCYNGRLPVIIAGRP